MRKSAVVLLVVTLLAGCSGRRAEMRERLSVLNALNRADTVLTATHRDEAQELADWFDRHGSSNEQMLAHYLLGRCYADMHETPMALHCYQEAISHADTTTADCDFAQLSRVYGQSATIFYQQGLYRNQLEYEDIASAYAWRGNDTLAALQCYAMKAAAYDQLQIHDSAILIYTDAIKQMKAYNYNKVAAGYSGTLAKKLIDKEETSQAAPYMLDYEKQSGYFDAEGKIIKGREAYNSIKGLYFLQTNQLDSAEYYFRKALRDSKDFNNQNGGSYGLALLYQLKNIPDSTAKYFAYSYAMNDSMYAHKATQEVEQAKAMYDYTRNQELAQQEKEKAEASLRLLWCIAIIIVLVSAAIARVFYLQGKEKRKQQAEHEALINAHIDMQAEVMQLRERKANYDFLLQEKEEQSEALGAAHAEIEELRSEKERFDQMLKEKEDKIEQQKAAIGRYKRLARLEKDSLKRQLYDAPIYQHVSFKATRGLVLTNEEWKELELFVVNRLPEFYMFVSSREHGLTTIMYHVCILVRLQFSFISISHMMGVKAPTITKVCSVVLKKLFGQEGSGKDLEQNLIQFN